MERIKFINSPQFENFIIAVIIINAITLGMETSPALMERMGGLLIFLDHMALAIFSLEILLKIISKRFAYFKDPWNVFDFIIVGISYVPAQGSFSVLRSLRVLRLFLLITSVTRLKVIVRSLVLSLPNIASICILMTLLFYVSAVIATNVFGKAFPDWFGSLSESLFTLFQIMTLESWAMGIVRPICAIFPYAPFFFVPFVLISSFVILNLFIAVIINAINDAREQFLKKLESQEASKACESQDNIHIELKKINGELGKIIARMEAMENKKMEDQDKNLQGQSDK